MTRFYVDDAGNYLGGYDGAEAPIGSIEVDGPPAHGADIWDGTAWIGVAEAPQQSISPRQFLQALNHFGYRQQVDAAVAASTDQNIKDWYARASEFQRRHPEVLSMASALGFTDTQLDQVWSYGAAL
jgi:hypothetical protein